MLQKPKFEFFMHARANPSRNQTTQLSRIYTGKTTS